MASETGDPIDWPLFHTLHRAVPPELHVLHGIHAWHKLQDLLHSVRIEHTTFGMPDLCGHSETLITVSCHCVIDVVLLDCVFCTRLIRTRIIVCSVSCHQLLLEFDIPEMLLQLIHRSMKCQCVERPNLQGVSCRPSSYMELASLPCVWYLNVGRILGGSFGCFSELRFLNFSGAGACEMAKPNHIQFCFPTWACAAAFNNNNNNNNNKTAQYWIFTVFC